MYEGELVYRFSVLNVSVLNFRISEYIQVIKNTPVIQNKCKNHRLLIYYFMEINLLKEYLRSKAY